MAESQRAVKVQPVRTCEHAGYYLRAVVLAARTIPAVLAGLAPVVAAQGIGDTIPADAAPAARPVEQVPPVEAGEPGRDRPAGRSRFPGCELVQAVEGPADVRVGNEPVLGVGRCAVVACPGAHGAGRFAGQHGEPFRGRGRRPGERGVKHLLHFRPRSQAGLLVPACDRAHGDPQVRGERLVAHPQRRLQRARVVSGPAGHQVHDLPPQAEMTAPRPGLTRPPGSPGRAQARSAIPRGLAGLTAIRRAARSLGRSPVSSVASSPRHVVTRRADPIGSPKAGRLSPPGQLPR